MSLTIKVEALYQNVDEIAKLEHLPLSPLISLDLP